MKKLYFSLQKNKSRVPSITVECTRNSPVLHGRKKEYVIIGRRFDHLKKCFFSDCSCNKIYLFHYFLIDAMITGDVLETTIGMTGLTVAAAATGWGLSSVAITSAAVGVYKVVKLLWRIQRRLR